MSKPTLILTVIGLVQIAAILFLYSKLVDIDDNMNLTVAAEQNTLVSDDLTNTQSQSDSNDTYLYPIEDRLRQIIREELGAQLDGQPRPNKQMDTVIASSSTDKAEIEYQRELVSQQLEYYSSVGSISDTDMQKLQMDIAKLDEASRKEMLRELMRALNSGRLEGRL